MAVTAAAGLAAVLANRLSERVKVPLPAFFLAAAAIVRLLVPEVDAPPHQTVERVVTIALVLILFDGGQSIGRARFRAAAAPIAVVGVLGTFLTTAATAVLIHAVFGLEWYLSVLVATAVAPTDPAVVFSVLGNREIAGRSGTILEGESGVNDPVGIALMTSLIAAGGLGLGAFGDVGASFLREMAIGVAVGVAGGAGLLWATRRVALPDEGLYPLRTLATVLLIFGLATVAHGSGFLAVFVAGVILGDERAPYKREIDRFHAALASLGEIVAFATLGLTLDLNVLARSDVWVPGVVLGAALAVAIRPPVIALCLARSGLDAGERRFVLFAGLKGAVPILLGTFILASGVAGAERAFGIVAIVVMFSVVVQGSLVPAAARRLGLRMETVETEPWALGVRLRDEPEGVHRFTIRPDAPADGSTIGELDRLPDDAWVSLVVRERRLVNVGGSTRLCAGDEVLVIADQAGRDDLLATFERPIRDRYQSA